MQTLVKPCRVFLFISILVENFNNPLYLMKTLTLSVLTAIFFLSSCTQKQAPANPIIGTWQLLTHTEITKGVSAVTDYTKDLKMIKIINSSHFAFLNHTINTKKDSSNNFDAGGGAYTLSGDKYTEHLDYYKDKNWEGKSFDFTISFSGDTLIQKGLEKIDKENINRVIIEKYLRVK
jgi:hypothetical protein